MATRKFFPPPACSSCSARPLLGETLTHTGTVWICPACLTERTEGSDVITKAIGHAIQSEGFKSLSRRARAAGEIAEAETLAANAHWHQNAAAKIKMHGGKRDVVITQGEVVPDESFLRDTLADPDLVSIESSHSRGHYLLVNDIVALGIDVANTVRASNTAEKLIAHEIALAHKVAMQQANLAQIERDPAISIKRLQVSARMMATAQEGLLNLQKLKSTGPQSVTVQHVHVEAGGQAVVGSVHPHVLPQR